MSDYLSSNESQPCQPGSIVVNVGQGQWKTLANASSAYGCLIGMNVKLVIPGNPITVVTSGRFPYDAYNLGAGNAQAVVIGNVPSRQGLPATGQVIGTCGPDGEITLSRSYLGEPANGIVQDFSGYALSGTALATGQTWALDATGKLVPTNVVSGSGGFPSGTGIIHVTGGNVNSPAYIGSADQFLVTNHTATDTAWVSINGSAGQDASYANGAWSNLAIHGATVPAAGSLTTGNVLQVSGASSLTYGPLNLAGGGASITGNLPTSNFAPGTASQVLMTNGAVSVTWATLSQDATLSNAGAVTVGGLLAHALPSLATGVLNWSGSAWQFSTFASIFTPGGDLTGNATAQYVQSIGGANNGGGTVNVNGTNTLLNWVTNAITLQQNATTLVQLKKLSTDFIAGGGSNVSGTGLLRAANNITILGARNAANTADLAVVKTDASNNCVFGDPVNGTGAKLFGNTSAVFETANYNVTLTDSTATLSTAVTNIVPGTDVTTTVGSHSLRYKGFSAGPIGFSVYGANTDTQPSTQLTTGAIEFGPGGSTPEDVELTRVAAGVLQVDNNANGNATLLVGGTSSGNQLEIASSNTTINVQGTGASGAQSTGLTLNPQTPSSGASSYSGNVTMNFSAPVSPATTFGMLVINQTGAGQSAGVGAYGSNYGGFWGGAGPYNNTNYSILSNGNQTFINASAASTVYVGFGGGGGASYVFDAGNFYPFNPHNNDLGTVANYWLNAYSETYLFPASLTTHGLVGWSGASTGAGQDTYVSAQNPVASGSSNGGSIWLASGGSNGGTGLPGNVYASIGGNTSHAWTPTGTAGTFQVLDGNSLQFTVGSYAAVTGGTTSWSAMWLSDGTSGATPTSGNYTLAQSSAELVLNAVSGGELVFGIGGTLYAVMNTVAFFPNGTYLELGESGYPWGASYIGGNSTGYFSFLTPTGTHNSQTNQVSRQIADFHTNTSTNGQVAWTSANGTVGLMYYLEVRWLSKDTSKNTAAGGRSTAIFECQAGGMSLLGTNTDVVEPASNNTITLATNGASAFEIQVNPSGGSGSDATDWQFEITIMVN